MSRIAAFFAGTLLSISAVFGASFPEPAMNPAPAKPGNQTAVFAGGCFWGIELVFEHVKGVKSAVAGYSGGSERNAEYERVSTGTTGHAESVQVTFDPSQVTYAQLLKVFFSVGHDPTQLNRQHYDVGTQYRSVIFYGNDEQKTIAQAYIAQLDASKIFNKPIVTQVVPLTKFYPAEEYHQHFAQKNPNHGYIVQNDAPKVEELKKYFPELYRK